MILIATDLSARGIDLPGISHVINYDIPDDPENYVHRIGRTGRGFAKGAAVSFLSPEENDKLTLIEEFISTKISVLEVTIEEPDLTEEEVDNMDIAAMLTHEEALVAPRKDRKKKKKFK